MRAHTSKAPSVILLRSTIALTLAVAPASGISSRPPLAGNTAAPVLGKLSNQNLLKEYEAAGLALGRTGHAPSDGPGISAMSKFGDPAMRRFQDARGELLRRRAAVVPDLITFLRGEVTRRRPAMVGGGVPGFTTDVIDLLVAIDDPRATGILTEILEGTRLGATDAQRQAALIGLERLTYCSFRKLPPHQETFADAVPIATARTDDAAFRADAAKMYRNWLQGEGKNAKQWLDLARKRARRILASDDLPAIYSVADFLARRGVPHALGAVNRRDDEPGKTVARLAELLAAFRREQDGYGWKGQPVPVNLASWVGLLTSYGPWAQPYAKLLIRLQEERGREDWSGFAQLRLVGGEELMSYFFRCLLHVQQASLREVQLGIDRWAGRRFANDSERLRWWQANKGKTQETWLRNGLPIVAVQADAGDPHARRILEEMLPNLLPAHLSIYPPSAQAPTPPEASPSKSVSRVAWLRENQHRLAYDQLQGGFRFKGQ